MNKKRLALGLSAMTLAVYLDRQAFKARESRVVLRSKKALEDIRISQISDFHSNVIGNLDDLLGKIRSFDPHFIILTGDIIDYGEDKKIARSMYFLKNLTSLSKPIFFISGNHEERGPKLDEFLSQIRALGIRYLANESLRFKLGKTKINLFGSKYYERTYKDYAYDPKAINIILSHSFKNIRDDKICDFDFIFSGHTHGGQVRLPFFGGILAPSEGFLPKYDKGIFSYKNGIVYIDSGLGNTFLPLRFLDQIGYSNITISNGSVV
ncbi:MAG: metallophosphoesterase [Anaerococcus sp.]|nr:metallophosphoesterase [Anaerococcus sp.]